ncbi:unnamed protein product, partial [Mycena citricolor]
DAIYPFSGSADWHAPGIRRRLSRCELPLVPVSRSATQALGTEWLSVSLLPLTMPQAEKEQADKRKAEEEERIERERASGNKLWGV